MILMMSFCMPVAAYQESDVPMEESGQLYVMPRVMESESNQQSQMRGNVQSAESYQAREVNLLGGWVSRDHLFRPYYDTEGKKLFIFNPRNRSWAAYNKDGNLINSGVASGGGDFCRDVGRPCRTPEGQFAVYRKGGMGCVSGKYPRPNGGSKMPMCVFFKGGYAIHGSHHVPERYNASHGCIRVHTPAAIWLNRQFLAKGVRVWVLPY